MAAILPGLVNAHTHLDYTIARGLIDGETFAGWILRIISCAARLQYEGFLTSARLGALQLVRTGTTTISDPSYSGAAVQAAADAGLRGIVYQETFGPDPSADDRARITDQIAALQSRAGERLRVGISPHSPYTSSAGRLRMSAELSRDHDLPMSVHIAETAAEVEFVRDGTGPLAEINRKFGLDFQATGMTPVEYFENVGMLQKNTVAAHCVHVSDGDIDILANTSTGLAHCPKSNARLASGIARFADMLRQGVRAGIGTDSAVSGDPLDMFEEMRTAVLMQRAVSQDVCSMNARTALESATIGGATALGLQDSIGSLEPGKRADIVAVDLSGTSAIPAPDPYSALVYSCSGSDVVMTMVGGEILYRFGRFARVDEEEIKTQATELGGELR
jgi:5-methylthioadenosine/S-adenosylhomocysteine deaminase